VNKLLIFILISFLLNNCSLNKNSKLWNEKEKIENENKNLKKILVEKKNVVSELNASLKLDLSKSQNNKKTNNKLNNFGSLEYEGNLNKIATHKFSKFENSLSNLILDFNSFVCFLFSFSLAFNSLFFEKSPQKIETRSISN